MDKDQKEMKMQNGSKISFSGNAFDEVATIRGISVENIIWFDEEEKDDGKKNA